MQNLFDTEGASGTLAAWAAAAITIVAGWWKVRLIMRRDSRVDGEYTDVHGGYRQLVVDLKHELERVRAELEREIAARREAEKRAELLMRRITELERQCDVIVKNGNGGNGTR